MSTSQPVLQNKATSGSVSIFGDLSEYPENPVEAAQFLNDNGMDVIPFKMWISDSKVRKMPAIHNWKPLTISWSDRKEIIKKTKAFGIIVPKSVIVIDLDTLTNGNKQKYVGLDSLVSLSEKYKQSLDFLDTVTVNTPSGGMHLWYRCPNNINYTNSAGTIGKNIDLRVPERGLILMPGSVSPNGRKYEFEQSAFSSSNIFRAPGWLLQEIRKTNKEFRKDLAEPKREYKFDGSQTNIEKYLTERADKIRNSTIGSRNNIFNYIAYNVFTRVASNQVPSEAAETYLYQAAIDSGLDHKEVTATLNSARRAAL